jgi:hypothetical protein
MQMVTPKLRHLPVVRCVITLNKVTVRRRSDPWSLHLSLLQCRQKIMDTRSLALQDLEVELNGATAQRYIKLWV